GGVGLGWDGAYMLIVAAALIGGVLAAVHHAEVVAHRVGEPFGTLLLAIAITIIEVALIVSLMLAGGPDTATLARDTVFAAVMIILTGIIGLSLFIGGLRFKEQSVGWAGVSASLVTLTAISVLTLVLPNYTITIEGPAFSSSQLLFIAIVSIVLYGTFIFVQTVRHRDFFLPAEADSSEDEHAVPPTKKVAFISGGLLLVCLTAVVTLAKALAPTLESGVHNIGAPKSLVGVIIAAVVLLPEGLAAVRAAKKNRVQTSLNLSLGSALASIGLTIPAVAVVSLVTGLSLTIGIDTKSTVLLVLSLFTIMLSLATGKTNILQGVVLLVIFAVYIFTTIVP
ncbi:MAG: ionic transporter y4hA, partial [Chitinophagaceae bacterium]|nr:ionic transporter y4hA [Chitinophagaceae bacterium]